MNEQKSHPFLALIVLLAAMALSAFGGYKYYEYRNIEQDDIEEKEDKETKEEKNEITLLTEKEVKDIYAKKMPIMETYGEKPNTYQSTKKDINNMDLSYLRGFLYTKIEFKDGDISSYLPEDAGKDFEYLHQNGWFKFKPELMQEQAKKYFGQEIENGDFEHHVGGSGKFENGEYIHSMGGSTFTYTNHLRQFVSYEQEKDTLTIKDNYLVYYFDSQTNTYTVYNTSEKVTPVATFTLENEMTNEETNNYMLNTYEVYLKEYTHTFKKDDKDNWYWVSTKPSE